MALFGKGIERKVKRAKVEIQGHLYLVKWKRKKRINN